MIASKETKAYIYLPIFNNAIIDKHTSRPSNPSASDRSTAVGGLIAQKWSCGCWNSYTHTRDKHCDVVKHKCG